MNVVPEPSERCTTVMSRGRQLDAGVQLGDRRVVPLLDLAEEDVGEQRAGELQLAATPRQVVDRHHGAEHGGEVQDLARRRLQLVVRHRLIGRAEEHRLAGQLPDAGARSERLIVDLDARLAACCTRRTTSSRSGWGTSRPRR